MFFLLCCGDYFCDLFIKYINIRLEYIRLDQISKTKTKIRLNLISKTKTKIILDQISKTKTMIRLDQISKSNIRLVWPKY